jgi:hypothetical protein
VGPPPPAVKKERAVVLAVVVLLTRRLVKEVEGVDPSTCVRDDGVRGVVANVRAAMVREDVVLAIRSVDLMEASIVNVLVLSHTG